MKKIILLLGICFCISGVNAQRFIATPLADGDVYEIKIKQFKKLYRDYFTPERLAKLTPGDGALRGEWRDSCAGRLLTADLTKLLKDVAGKDGGEFWVTFYLDKNGNVMTVTFTMTTTVYVRLTTEKLREIYNRALKEKPNPNYYAFDDEHDYAVEGVELMKRAVAKN